MDKIIDVHNLSCLHTLDVLRAESAHEIVLRFDHLVSSRLWDQMCSSTEVKQAKATLMG